MVQMMSAVGHLRVIASHAQATTAMEVCKQVANNGQSCRCEGKEVDGRILQFTCEIVEK